MHVDFATLPLAPGKTRCPRAYVTDSGEIYCASLGWFCGQTLQLLRPMAISSHLNVATNDAPNKGNSDSGIFSIDVARAAHVPPALRCYEQGNQLNDGASWRKRKQIIIAGIPQIDELVECMVQVTRPILMIVPVLPLQPRQQNLLRYKQLALLKARTDCCAIVPHLAA